MKCSECPHCGETIFESEEAREDHIEACRSTYIKEEKKYRYGADAERSDRLVDEYFDEEANR